MCGIIGAIGDQNTAKILFESLQRLEYRGYDSSGIVVDNGTGLVRRRAVGKLKNLAAILKKEPLTGQTGIGHTRWATHGGVTEENAHPILTADETIAVVHNGIIENHRTLREELIANGHVFSSETDTEVLCHLFAEALKATETPAAATAHVLKRIEGAYAFAVLMQAWPGMVAVARNASPLAVGFGEGANFIGSDAMAMGEVTRRILFLKDGDYGIVTADHAEIYDAEGKPAQREVVTVAASSGLISKEGYSHFMEKEIHEQPDAIAHTLAGMTGEDGHLTAAPLDAAALNGVLMLAAGTSHNAAMIGKYWFEDLADLPAATEIASEFRYRNPAFHHFDLAIGISQSGESLDTLMALRHAAENGVQTMGLVNVPESTIARETDLQLLTRAGPEIGVASTKTFTAQLTVLLSLAIAAGRDRNVLAKERVEVLEDALISLPRLVGAAMSGFDEIKPHVEVLAQARSCLFLGRGVLFPLALEGALKLKELSYIHAEGYASGEMKHGPIALVEEGLPIIALISGDQHHSKAVSNLMEAKARGANVIALATEDVVDTVADLGAVVTVPACDPVVAPVLLSVPAQILAYLVAEHKGTDVDQPRNLAKSVTVE
jgi:glucosamine--fructose-6-phosphate aminotransferase (isomerizing)